MDVQRVRLVNYSNPILFCTDRHLHSVNGETTPIATAGPCAYRKAKNDAIRDAAKAIEERQNREQVHMEEERDECAQ